MIKIEETQSSNPKPIKAVGLMSGGLDSTLAVQMIRDLGIEVHGLYFSQPWGCCDKNIAQEAAEKLGIKFIVLQLNDRYLELVKKPKYGYGTALNPCIDCRIHMFSRAQQYMVAIGAEFVFTGEVIGQRPMSQTLKSLSIIERECKLEGRLLRPLSAQHLEPTIPEKEGNVNRAKLLSLSGRSRSEQIEMAKNFGITDYLPTGGGCLLTDKNFARRMQDTLDHGYRNFRETIGLKWGRHFRLTKDFKAVLGRDAEENISLRAYAHLDDHIFEMTTKQGPTLILKGYSPTEEILTLCASLIQKFSKFKEQDSIEVEYWPVKDKNLLKKIPTRKLSDPEVAAIQI